MDRLTTFQITDEISRVLKKLVPEATAHLEHIDNKKLPTFSIEIISDTSTTVSAQHEERSLELDIIYFSKSKKQQESMEIASHLMAIFLPTFKVGDKYFTFHQGVESRFVQGDLHFMISFQWQQSIQKSFVDAADVLVSYNATDETKAVVANRLHDIENMETINTKIERG